MPNSRILQIYFFSKKCLASRPDSTRKNKDFESCLNHGKNPSNNIGNDQMGTIKRNFEISFLESYCSSYSRKTNILHAALLISRV